MLLQSDETVNHIINKCSSKRINNRTWVGGWGDLLGIMQEIEIRLY